jgi:hypothetical protein
VGVSFGTRPDRNHAFINQFVWKVPVLPRDAAVNRVVRLHRPDFAVPDMYFEHAHTEAVVVAGRISNNIRCLWFTVHVVYSSSPFGINQIIT